MNIRIRKANTKLVGRVFYGYRVVFDKLNHAGVLKTNGL